MKKTMIHTSKNNGRVDAVKEVRRVHEVNAVAVDMLQVTFWSKVAA
jgi:hypothetical protein